MEPGQELKKIKIKVKDLLSINNGNRTEWSTIKAVIG